MIKNFFLILFVMAMSATGLMAQQGAAAIIMYPMASSVTDDVIVTTAELTSTGGVDTLFVDCLCSGGGGLDTSTVGIMSAPGITTAGNSGLAPNTLYECYWRAYDSLGVVRDTSRHHAFRTRHSPKVPEILARYQADTLYTGAMVNILMDLGGSDSWVTIEETVWPYTTIAGPVLVLGNGYMDTAVFVPIAVPGDSRSVQVKVCAVNSVWGCDLSTPLMIFSDSLDGCTIQSAWIDSITPTHARANVVVAEGGAGSCIVVTKLRPTIPANSPWVMIWSPMLAQHGDTISGPVWTSQGMSYEVQFTVSDTMGAVDTVLSFTTPTYGPPMILNAGMVSGQNPNSVVLSGVSAHVDAPGLATMVGIVTSQDPQYPHMDTVKVVRFTGDTTFTAVAGPIFGGVPYIVRWVLTDPIGQDTIAELAGISTLFPSAVSAQITNTSVGISSGYMHVGVHINGNGTVMVSSVNLYKEVSPGYFVMESSNSPNDITAFRDSTFGPYLFQGLDPNQSYMGEAVVEAVDGIRAGETTIVSWLFTTNMVGAPEPVVDLTVEKIESIEIYAVTGVLLRSVPIQSTFHIDQITPQNFLGDQNMSVAQGGYVLMAKTRHGLVPWR